MRSEKSNNGFILLMALLSDCIEYLSHKLGVTFYNFVNLCSLEIICHSLTRLLWSVINFSDLT